MSRPRKSFPSYLPHQSGGARAIWTDQTGTRHFRMLPGKFDSPESRAAFTALLLEQQATPHHVQAANPTGMRLGELLLLYLDHAEQHYRRADGTPTSEIYEVRIVIRALRELYGETLVSAFGPLCVKAARQRWVNDGRSRTECNRRVAIIKRIMKWAVSEELAPASVCQAVSTVVGLQAGRTTAHEMDPILPVADEVVEQTLPFLNRHVRGLIEFQRLTGCRPGEACSLRRCDIDTGGVIWLFNPPHHKNTHKGKSRTISIGPKAQALLKEFFTPNIADYVFSPAVAMEELRSEKSAKRKTPRYPSHLARNAEKRVKAPERMASEKYDTQAYGHAIATACKRAFPPVGEVAQRENESHVKWWARLTGEQRDEVKAWHRDYNWHPNQLRHSFATLVRKSYGLESAQVLLGHSKADVTQIYAEKNLSLAASVATAIG